MAVEKKSKKDELLNKNVIIIDPVMKEESGSKIVISFGRMNPPTVGHEKLVNKVKDIARKEGAKAEVYLSQTQDAKKNPLSYDDKVMLAREAFGSIVQKINLKTIIDVMKHISGKYAEVILVVGDDRVGEFDTLLNKYNGKDYSFSSIRVISAGQRDPDAEGVEGMSASKMRDAAKDGDEAKFKSGLPKKLQMHADDIYTMVRAGMKLAESYSDLEEYVLSLDQRRKRALVMRRYETKMQMSRERLKRRIASNQKLIGRSRKKAIEIIRKMVAGERGLNYHDLSVSDKLAIDKRVEQRKAAIGKIAARLLPKVRQAEMQRVQMLNKVNESFEQFIESDAYHAGLSPSTIAKRKAHFAKGAEMDDDNPAAYKKAPGDAQAKTKLSKHTRRYHMMYNGNGDLKYDRRFRAFKHIVRNEEYESDSDLLNMIEEVWDLAAQINESTELDEAKSMQGLKDKAEKSGISYGILKQVFNRGVAAWRTGHRPGTTPQQWGYARVNSFITKGPGTWGKADSDLAAKVRSESVNESFEQFVSEGVNDPSIFKAVFLAGGPGSGKSFIVGKTALTALGFKVINSDDIFERALTKAGLKTTPEYIYSPKGQEIRGQAKELTGKKMDLALNGRLGLVIDGTGKDYDKIEKQATKLKKLGYEVAMIFVNTDLDTAKARNNQRARSLPDSEVESMWNGVQKNIGKFQNFFGTKMFIVDNSTEANVEGGITSVYRKISAWSKVTPTNPEAKAWIASQKGLNEDKKSFKHHLGIGVPLKHVGKDALTHQDTDMDGDVDQDDFKKMVPDETSADPDMTKKFMKKYGDEKKHSRKGVAFESYHVPHDVSAVLVPDPEADNADDSEMSAYSRGRLKGSIARADKLKKFRYHEAYGAGFEGTDDLVQNFKAATPGEKGTLKKPKITDGIKINEAFAMMMEAEEEEITLSKMKDFEKFVDRMFEKFKIDFEFTKHFGERMNDERNSPKIKLKELADLIKKIYNKNGNPLKGQAGAELVVKDLQSDLNMPIVVKYDEKNDEIDIVAKTIMRKKNFSTPNPVIKY
jgi:shikimate kinase